jgi:hypothetical protein
LCPRIGVVLQQRTPPPAMRRARGRSLRSRVARRLRSYVETADNRRRETMRASILALAALALTACTEGPAEPGSDPPTGAGALQPAGLGVLQQATTTSKDVLIENTAAQPVPTRAVGTTTVSVANTPTVTLQAGSSVGITGTPSVSLAGSTFTSSGALLVRDQDSAPRQPFHTNLSGNFKNLDLRCTWTGSNTATATITVPNNKRLVIEYVAAIHSLQAGQTLLDVAVETTVGGNTVEYPFFGTFTAGDSINSIFVTQQMTRLYADPGTTVSVSSARSAQLKTGSCSVSLSGYLIDP